MSLRDVFCSSFSGGFRKLRIGSGPKRPSVSRERLIGLIARHPVALLIRSLSLWCELHDTSNPYVSLNLSDFHFFLFYLKKHEMLIACLFFLTCKDYLMTHINTELDNYSVFRPTT